MSNYACELCDDGIPRAGMRVCDTCLGLNTSASEKDTSASEKVKPAPNLCQTCGSAIEPYKIGAHNKTNGECHDCYYARRYGPGWKPGGQTRQEKAAKCKAWRNEKKKANGGNGKAPSVTMPDEEARPKQPTVYPVPAEEVNITFETLPECPTIIVPFEGPDEGIYFRLQAICTKERRTLEQQILYFLDRVVEV